MYKNGVLINEKTAKVVRLAGLLVPASLAIYCILIRVGLFNDAHYTSDIALLVIMVPWLLVAIYQFLFPSPSDPLWRLIVYHLFALLIAVFLTGVDTPFTASWVLLFLAAYAYYGRGALRLSVAAFVLTAILDSLLHLNNPEILLINGLWLIVIFIVGITGGVIARIQEVSEAEILQIKAQQTLQRDRILTIVNNLTDAILSTDRQGVIRLYNAASLNLLDTNESLNGTHINDALPLKDANNKKVKLFTNLKTTQSVVERDDLSMTIGDDTYRLEVTYSPIRSSYSRSKKSDLRDGYILILRDITKAKSLEEERDEFISVVSHELRTPITTTEGTISNVQLMMERDMPKKQLKDSLASAHEQVMYLAKMVNDLSTLSRAERGVADTAETIKVRNLIDELYRDYAPQAEAKGLRFNLDLAPHLGHVNASPLYLKEMLQNFITNAIKYTKEGGVTIRANRDKTKNTVTFEIKDTGIGISKSDQVKVFNKFYRAEDYRTRETSGTGLGLYVTAKLAKKLNTKIELRSRLNHGSTVSFTLKSQNIETSDK